MKEKKLELLKKLKVYVESDKNIKYEYKSDGCYCSVGFLMNEVGINLDSEQMLNLNATTIEMLDYDVSIKELEDHFSISELIQLQKANDCDDKESLINIIDSMIKEAEAL